MGDGNVSSHHGLDSHSCAPEPRNAVPKSSSITDAPAFPVGYKFRRLLDANAQQEGEVVDIITGNVRKVFYYESGTVEELTISQLRELASPKFCERDRDLAFRKDLYLI